MSAPLRTFKSHIDGKNADVEIYADRIVWDRKRGMSAGKLGAGLATGGLSLLATGAKSSKAGSEMIPVKAISSVITSRDGLMYTKVSVIASGNTIDFRVSHAEAPAIKDLLTSLVLGSHPAQQAPAPSTPVVQPASVAAPTVPHQPAPIDVADQIRRLADLHSAGILTDDEFSAKKADLLGRL